MFQGDRWRNVANITLTVMLVGILLIFVVVIFSDNHEWTEAFLGEKGKKEVLTFLGFGMGGILAALSVLVAHKRAKALADTAHEQAVANEHVEQGHRQERFKTAVDHLGHESPSVRLGGAYELVHLARDNQDFRGTALKILCAHIREKTQRQEYKKEYKDAPSEEIQTLLSLLFREQSEIFKKSPADLHGSYLNGAYIGHARLGNVDFTKAYLQKADLENSDMRGSCFIMAKLQEAHLYHADMKGSILVLANLEKASFSRSQLQGATLGFATLSEAQFNGAQLQGVTNEGEPSEGVDKSAASSSDIRQLGNRIKSVRAGRYPIAFQKAIEGAIDRDADSRIQDFFTQRASEEGEGNVESYLQTKNISLGAYTREEAEEWIAEYKEAYG